MNTFTESRFGHFLRHLNGSPASVLLLRAVEDGLCWLAGHVGRFATAWQRDGDAAAMAQALGGLDDRMLRDLGIHRSELLSLAHNPRDVTRARSTWM